MWGIRRSLCKNLIFRHSIYKASNIIQKETPNSDQNEPKWMRFFKGYQPLQVDIERSLMNENSDLLNSHVRNNYKSFTFSQLIQTLEKLNKQDVSLLIKNEIQRRVIALDYDDLQINKDALTIMLTSNKIQANSEIFEQIILIYGHKIFDKLDFCQKMQFFQFIDECGLSNAQLQGELLQQIQNENLDQILNQMTLQYLLLTLNICQNLKKNETFQNLLYMTEDKIFQILSDKNNLHHVSSLFNFVKPERPETLHYMIQTMELQIDPQQYGLYRSYKLTIDMILKQQFKTLFNDLGYQYRQLLFRLIILQGNQIKKYMEFDLKPKFARIQLKYQIYHSNFANLWLKESIVNQNNLSKVLNDQDEQQQFKNFEQYLQERTLYFYGINAHQIIQSGHLLDLRNQYELFHLNNLQVIKNYSNRFPTESLLRHLHVVIQQQPPVVITQLNDYLNVLNDSQTTETELNQNQIRKEIFSKLENLKLQTQLLGYTRNTIQSQCQTHFQAVDQLLLLIQTLSVLVQNYTKEQIGDQIDNFSQIWNSITFNQFMEQFGMTPHLAENLIQIVPYLKKKLLPIEKIQDKMDKIFNVFNEDPQQFILSLEKDVEEFYEKITLKNRHYQEYSQQQLHHTRIFNINDKENYYLKLLNGPIIQKIMKHTPLKQIIRDTLSIDDWKMNFVKYPALADFINEKEKVALFVIDETRMIMNVKNVYDKNTLESISYFKKLGYKTICIDSSCYSVKRSDIQNKINQMIQS